MEQRGIEIRLVDQYSALDRLALSGGDDDPAQVSSLGLVWLPKTHHLLVCRDGTVVAHVGFVLQTVFVEARSIRVAGIGGVLTRRDCRGQGLGAIGMKAVEDLIRRERMAPFGMLFCREQLQSWYERMGWSLVPEPVWFDQPQGVRQSPMVVMVKCFNGEDWPAGEVRIRSLPW